MSVPDDPLNFIPADLFFPTVPNFQKPTEVVAVESSESIKPSDPLRYAAHITLGGVNGDSQTQCLVQFVTPLIWRIRYDPKYTSLSDFEDTNTRTIVRDTFSGLVDGLQQEYRDSDARNAYPAGDEWFWRTSFKQLSTDHWVLTSNEYQSKNGTATPKTSLHIFKSPFRIVATRKLKTLEADTSLLQSVGVDTTSELEQIIWQTTDQTFSYQKNSDIDAINNVVLNVKKPGPAEYLGFGEQGGKTVLKKPTYLNYFCYDNFNYLKVYGQGALDGREPLYQSSPFYLEMNGTPTYQNVTGVMIDNYSQVAIDLGKNDSNIISIATRFNTFDAYILTADDVPTMICELPGNILWSLYSYNLHKATYHGLSNLKGRENKRNFIIGRGSQTGMHRFAGLWTGDNGSSWDFWKISVAQVLALGYSGLTIAGVDMGGFTSDPTSNASYPRWCNPELFIRWYSGAFLLPWYRNHYMQHWDQQSNPPAKVFQEPWAFSDVLSNQYAHLIPQDQRVLYEAVVPICRYYVQLRYSLIQVLYDCMFANLINGLPIARAMLITDPLDTSLFNTNESFIDTQYLLGHNILVCPIVDPQVYNRDVYLPGTDLWYPSNLRVDNQNFGPDPILKHAADLEQPVKGGRIISYGCSLPAAFNRPDQVPFITPVYIRGGAIIPQLDVRQFIGENDLNPPTIHFYPGGKKVTSYSMYLDDGVSKDSAPNNLPQYKYQDPAKSKKPKGFYREVKMTQESTSTARTLTIRHPWNGFDAKSTVGDIYNLAVWTVKTGGAAPQVQVSFQDENGKTVDDARLSHNYDGNRGVLTVNVPVDLVPSLDHPATTNGSLTNGSTNGASVNGHSKDRHIAVKITDLT